MCFADLWDFNNESKPIGQICHNNYTTRVYKKCVFLFAMTVPYSVYGSKDNTLHKKDLKVKRNTPSIVYEMKCISISETFDREKSFAFTPIHEK
jgi:hypothetical protein